MWAAIVKKGLHNKMGDITGKRSVYSKTTNRGGGGQGRKCSLSVWKTARVPYGKGTFKDGDWVYKQKDIKYRLHTNPAGIQQCKRQSGHIAVLMGSEKTYTSQFRVFRTHKETDGEFQERTKKAKEKRLRMLFCPELVEITLDPTLSREQRLDRFHKFIEENYPEDMNEDEWLNAQVGYGENVNYRDLKPGDTHDNVSKFCKVEGGQFVELTFDLRVVWIKPGTKFKIMEDIEYGTEYLITDEDFDVV